MNIVGSPQASPAHSEKAVLVVEDNFINQKVVVATLKKLGYVVEIVEDGVGAIEEVKTNGARYHAILMDWHMPNMNGCEATGLIRSMEGKIATIPIIAMTASAMVGDREKCLAAGMDDYIAKPLRIAKLREILEKWIK